MVLPFKLFLGMIFWSILVASIATIIAIILPSITIIEGGEDEKK
jgi:hypothetical protein